MGSPYMLESRYFRTGTGKYVTLIVCTRWDELVFYESLPDIYTPISWDEYNQQMREWDAEFAAKYPGR